MRNAAMIDVNQPASRTNLLYALLVIGLIAYMMPWIDGPSSGMTLNAYDLAEWTSLYPPQRATSPPLLAPLLLRMQLLLMSVMFGLLASGRASVAISATAILLLAAAQLPPVEILDDPGNLNYRQQLFLAGASLIAGWACVPLKRQRFINLMLIGLALIAAGTAIIGQREAASVYAELEQAASSGFGLWLLVLANVAIAALAGLSLRLHPRQRS